MSSRQKPRLLPAETQPRSEKAPQATFSHRLVRAARAGGARARRSRARGALLALLLELLANALALEVREVVDEELALEMIHLVLDAHGKDVLEVALEEVAVAVLGAQPDLRRALDLVEDPRHRQAPLLGTRFALAREDLRVDDREGLIALRGKVDDEEALVHVDLGGREPDAGRAVHGLEHVVDQRAEGGVEARHRLRARAQPGVGVLQDGSEGHGSRVQYGGGGARDPAHKLDIKSYAGRVPCQYNY